MQKVHLAAQNMYLRTDSIINIYFAFIADYWFQKTDFYYVNPKRFQKFCAVKKFFSETLLTLKSFKKLKKVL